MESGSGYRAFAVCPTNSLALPGAGKALWLQVTLGSSICQQAGSALEEKEYYLPYQESTPPYQIKSEGSSMDIAGFE